MNYKSIIIMMDDESLYCREKDEVLEEKEAGDQRKGGQKEIPTQGTGILIAPLRSWM